MASDLTGIIVQLEQQGAAIDRALSALREIGGGGTPDTAAKRRGRPPGFKQAVGNTKVEAAGHARSEGQRRRWAEKKSAEAAPAPKKRSGLATAGRKRLSEMMKARWASKNPPKTKARA